MRLRALALATATGLVLTVAPATAAEAARKPAYKVSISTSTANPSVGTTVKVTGKVTGPKAAKKRLLVQRKVGAGKWTTVAKVRTTKSRKYAARVKVSTAGKHAVRVVAPKSSKARAGSSRARSFTGWRWLDLTKQPNQGGGDIVNGPVTIAGKSYPKAFTFRYSGVYFNTGGKCTTLRGSVGTPDPVGASLLALTFANQDLDDALEYRTVVAAGAAPKAASYPVSGKPVVAFGDGGGEGRVSIVAPELRCSINALPAMELPPL
ncbi:hypothetical protein [Aeromicrobium choanae]|uniref:Uncharacterized protein n=1 Tax=Aeromicrobium choanae TaxID=1736691 RepID=A0A1T4Z0G9_9ACTN|nr:hypothetical protein [Aeromicrobium choanae]SKB07549.1 hypothetical protein SAMN06295964_1735 [Aeromicrobium choanae]